MPEIMADPPDPTCYDLFFGNGIQESQSLAPDLFSPRARGAHARDQSGRFAKGHSGNPQGRPPGIPNPKRRVIGLQAWRENRQGVLALAHRKPWLLRPLLLQVLPPRRAIDPAERLGIDLSSLRTAEDFRRLLSTVLAAVSRGDIAPAEALRIARHVRARLRAERRLKRLARRLAHASAVRVVAGTAAKVQKPGLIVMPGPRVRASRAPRTSSCAGHPRGGPGQARR